MALSQPPGYRSLVLLDRVSHRGKGVRRDAARFAGVLQTVYLTLPEFNAAARHFPIVFAREISGTLHPFAVLSPVPGQNVWIDQAGNWRRDVYCPAYVRRYPFTTARTDDGGVTQALICVDESGLDDSPPHLFDSRGEPTPHWQDLQRFIEEFDAAQAQTRTFCARLEALGIVERFEAEFNPAAGPPSRLVDLWRVQDAKLRALSATVLADLVGDGTLARIYTHLSSLENFGLLSEVPTI